MKFNNIWQKRLLALPGTVLNSLLPDHILLFGTVLEITDILLFTEKLYHVNQASFFLLGTRLWYFAILKLVVLQGCFCCIFVSLIFKSKMEHLWNLAILFFLFHFSFSRKSLFNKLDIQISWRHQMPKHKMRNTFYWITWEVNKVC